MRRNFKEATRGLPLYSLPPLASLAPLMAKGAKDNNDDKDFAVRDSLAPLTSKAACSVPRTNGLRSPLARTGRTARGHRAWMPYPIDSLRNADPILNPSTDSVAKLSRGCPADVPALGSVYGR